MYRKPLYIHTGVHMPDIPFDPFTGEGTVYFKSIRRTKGARFETQDFKLVIDGNPKQTVELSSTDLLGLHKV